MIQLLIILFYLKAGRKGTIICFFTLIVYLIFLSSLNAIILDKSKAFLKLGPIRLGQLAFFVNFIRLKLSDR